MSEVIQKDIYKADVFKFHLERINGLFDLTINNAISWDWMRMKLTKDELKSLADFIYSFIGEEKEWVHSRPIVGTDENGQPIIIDSWGKDNNPLKGYQNAVDITRAVELQKEKN